MLRSLEAAVGSMKEATLQHPGMSAKATLPAKKKAAARKKGRKRRQQPKRRRSYELALELLSSSSESMTVAEIQRSLSKQGQELAPPDDRVWATEARRCRQGQEAQDEGTREVPGDPLRAPAAEQSAKS